jgi:hypothetical protein
MASRKKPKQNPSETYAARVARGRIPVSLSVSSETVDGLASLSGEWGCTRSAVVERVVREALERLK